MEPLKYWYELRGERREVVIVAVPFSENIWRADWQGCPACGRPLQRELTLVSGGSVGGPGIQGALYKDFRTSCCGCVLKFWEVKADDGLPHPTEVADFPSQYPHAAQTIQVEQDFRGVDPDRIARAFAADLDKTGAVRDARIKLQRLARYLAEKWQGRMDPRVGQAVDTAIELLEEYARKLPFVEHAERLCGDGNRLAEFIAENFEKDNEGPDVCSVAIRILERYLEQEELLTTGIEGAHDAQERWESALKERRMQVKLLEPPGVRVSDRDGAIGCVYEFKVPDRGPYYLLEIRGRLGGEMDEMLKGIRNVLPESMRGRTFCIATIPGLELRVTEVVPLDPLPENAARRTR